MTFPLDRYIADGVRRVKADPAGDLVWFTDAEFNERQAREQAIRNCIAAVEAAIGDRIRDLKSCGKDDDCDVWADACDVALDDALIALRALLEGKK